MILTYACFLPASLTPSSLVALASVDLGFEPRKVEADCLGVKPVKLDSRHLERISEATSLTSFRLSGPDGSLRLAGIGGWPGQQLVVETAEFPSDDFLSHVSERPGFVATLIGDADDVFWQSAEQVNTYRVHGRSTDGLPMVWDPVFGREKIDVSGNPGRQAPAPNMWLWAAAKMWFGPGAFALLDRERLLELPIGDVKLRVDGVVIVDLYELSDDLSSIRRAQQIFRVWLDYDRLEERGVELSRQFADPRLEFEIGRFPNGGVRRVTEWLNNGRLAARSVATERRSFELDPSGRIVFEERVGVAG